MAIPVLIRVLWLMFDEEGDGLSGCFQHVFTFVSAVSQEFSLQVVSMFLPWGVVSARSEATVIADLIQQRRDF